MYFWCSVRCIFVDWFAPLSPPPVSLRWSGFWEFECHFLRVHIYIYIYITSQWVKTSDFFTFFLHISNSPLVWFVRTTAFSSRYTNATADDRPSGWLVQKYRSTPKARAVDPSGRKNHRSQTGISAATHAGRWRSAKQNRHTHARSSLTTCGPEKKYKF